ncbi:MAG: type IV pilus secretin PilQ [Luteitalea sp.]|nr:type IV pilus secretin PilQ [Luteitalea sp.]
MPRGVALFLPFVLATAVAVAEHSGAAGAAVPEARLTAISSQGDAENARLVIEASAPVTWVTTRPDPLTVLLDFRNVAADGVANAVASNARGPISAVAVESADSGGTTISRVRISLSTPVAHHVKSDRNTVVVDFDAHSLPAPRPDTRLADGGMAAGRLTARIETPAIDPIAALGLSSPAAAGRQGPAPAGGAVATTLQAPAPPAPTSPQTTPAPSDTLQAGRGGRQYSGTPVSLDFQQADLRAVLRVFSEISGLNIVIDPTVQGTVDVALRDVPWDQALDIILRANKLGYLLDGTIVRIAPLTALAEEEALRRKLADEQSLSGDLQVFTKTLSYARAEELQALLLKSALSQRGTVQVDPRTNTLIITDLQDRLTTAADLIATLDRAQPQVEIEARVVQTNKDAARALGVQWGFAGRVDPAVGNTTNLAFPNNGSLTGRLGDAQGPTDQPTAVDLAAEGALNAVGLALGSVNGAFNLDVALSALERSGNGRLLSTPRVTTQNNVEAEIKQGVQIPIQTVANNTVTVTFKDAALTLRVTPQITASGTVIMKIALENATADFSRQVGGIPPINTQSAITTVLVSDGQTTVIGGIYTSTEATTNDRTPGLSRVPFLKWLFQRDTFTDQSSELLIFITPRIIVG